MLQKLEDAYLYILRFVVIVAAGLLLVCVVFFGLASMKGFGSGPEAIEPSPQVSQQEIIEELTASPSTDTSNVSPDADDSTTPVEAEDPNKIFYDRGVAVLVSFVERTSGEDGTLDEQVAYEVLQEKAEAYDSPQLTADFAKGMAEFLENMSVDSSVEALASSTTPFEVINSALNLYIEKFNEEIEANTLRNISAQNQHQTDQAQALITLYIAGGAFGAFLLLVFLSIFIRIERNLRHLETMETESV